MTPLPSDDPRRRRPLAGLAAAAWLVLAAVAPAHAAPPAPSASPDASSSPSASAPGTLSHGLFSDLRIWRPATPARQFVMVVTAGVEPTARERAAVRTLVDAGAMVVSVPLAPFYRRLARQDGKCTYGPGAFENLSRTLQALEHLPGYLVPMVAGVDGTSAYVHSLLAQAPAGTFSAGLGMGQAPLALTPPPCVPSPRPASGAAAATAATPWIVAPGASLAALDRAYRQLAAPQPSLGAAPPQLDDLPLVEVPAAAGGKRFAVLLSGDGGWAGIDKSLGSAFAAQGVPVAGFDSLRYFWSARTPDGLAADLDRVIRYYAAHWGRSEVLLVGYSQGADVLPFALNRLPPATRASIRLTALLGPGQKASFEFHVSNWIGPSGDLPIAPEGLKLSAADTVCLFGIAEKDSLCPELAPDHARAMPLSGGHHFGGDYDELARLILGAMPR